LHHIGVGRTYAGAKVMMLTANADVRVITTDGQFLGHLVIDPAKNYQPLQKDLVSTMS
jgi:hypothetical protein